MKTSKKGRRYTGAYRDSKDRIRPITPRKRSRAKTGVPMRIKETKPIATRNPKSTGDDLVTIDGVTKTRTEWLNLESDTRSGSFKQLPSGIHTGGVKKLESGKIAKPLVGRRKVLGEPDQSYPTLEYEAIKALEDLPHIPKGVNKKEIDGVPHLIRDDLHILEETEYRRMKREDVASIEMTVREANQRGWLINDVIQIGFDMKRGEFVIYDWSAAMFYGEGKIPGSGDPITGLWRLAGFENYVTARNWADRERFTYNLEHSEEDGLWRQYTYMSHARPPSKVWMKLPEDAAIQHFTMDEAWKPMGLIQTKTPLDPEQIKEYELIPTEYHLMNK